MLPSRHGHDMSPFWLSRPAHPGRGKDLWHKLFTFGAAWAPRATLPRVWCTAATAKASLAAVQSFSFLSFGAADQGAPVRCVTEPATTVNSWRESTLLCKIFGSSLGSNPCRQPTTSSKAGQRASACREKNKRLPMRRSQTLKDRPRLKL